MNYYKIKQSLETKHKEDPTNDDIMCKLASAMLEIGDREEALNLLLHAVEVRPGVQTYCNLGFFYLREGEPGEGMWNYQIDKAICMITKAINFFPTTYIPYSLLGEAYLANNQFIEAERILKVAVGMAPIVGNYNNLGVALFKQNKYEEAVQYFQKAHFEVKKNCYLYNPYLNYAICLTRLNRRVEAEEIAEFLISMCQENSEIYITDIAKVFYWNGNYKRAAELFNRAIEEFAFTVNELGVYISSLLKMNLYSYARDAFISTIKGIRESIDEINYDNELDEIIKNERTISLEAEIIEYENMYNNLVSGNAIEFSYDPVVEQPCCFFGCLRHNVPNYT